MSKRFISCFLLITIMLNFIFLSPCHSAGSDPDFRDTKTALEAEAFSEDEGNPDFLSSILDAGDTEDPGGGSRRVSTSPSQRGPSINGFIVGVLARVINVFVLQIDLMLAFLTKTEVVGEDQDNDNNPWLTIDKIVFNRIALLNIDYMNVPSTHTGQTYQVGNATIQHNEANIAIKQQVAKVYYVCRVLALIMSLGVLIYIGIRMAISTVASEQAKYQKMLIAWFESIIILAFMIYIMAAIILLGNKLTGVFYNIRTNLISNNSPILGGVRRKRYCKVWSF